MTEEQFEKHWVQQEKMINYLKAFYTALWWLQVMMAVTAVIGIVLLVLERKLRSMQ